MNKQKKFSLTTFIFCLIAGLASANEKHSEFLGEKIAYQPVKAEHGAEFYRAPGFSPKKFGEYKEFIVDPVIIWYSDESAYKGIFPDELKAVADYTRSRITRAIQQDGLTLAGGPGHGVLQFRIAITHMKRHKPLRVLDFTPIGAVVFGIEAAAGVNRPTPEKIASGHSYIMSATIEGGLFDSENGALLAAYKDKAKRPPHKQAKIPLDTEKGATWGQVKEAIDYWADLLCAHLHEAQGLTLSKPKVADSN